MIIVGITGASGVIYGKRVCEELAYHGKEVGLIITKHGENVISEELKIGKYSKEKLFAHNDNIKEYNIEDLTAPVSSGSFKTEGMIIVPCSINTLAGIASGICNNLLLRCAQVTLKERRKLIIVPRESPFNLIVIRNLMTLCESGADIVPPIPAFYNNPKTIDDLIDFTVSRILNLFAIENNLTRPWGESK